MIAPWATQARISQLIAEDFDAMAADRSIKEKAIKVSFGKFNTVSNSPQVGHARFLYPTPSRFPTRGGDKSQNYVVHRGITEQEFFLGSPAVRIYVTVFSEATVDKFGKSNYKDIHQDSKTKAIRIYTGDQQNPILWVNAGQPLRALKWYEKYKVQSGDAKPLIRSFLLPVSDYVKITKSAILEHDAGQSRNSKKSFNVDRHYASDQFGLRGAELKTLISKAVPGSLITYTDNPGLATKGIAGRIESTQSLRNRLGVPQQTIPGVWVDTSGKDFVKKDKFSGMADKLMNIYATWIGNDLFIADSWKSIPRPRRLALMDGYIREYGLFIPLTYWERIKGGESPAKVANSLK